MALLEATQVLVWLKVFLCELNEMTSNQAVNIYEDNQGSLASAKNIDIRYHFAREKVLKDKWC